MGKERGPHGLIWDAPDPVADNAHLSRAEADGKAQRP
jgi:hypothetical protein